MKFSWGYIVISTLLLLCLSFIDAYASNYGARLTAHVVGKAIGEETVYHGKVQVDEETAGITSSNEKERPGGNDYDVQFAIKATPDAGYKFDYWRKSNTVTSELVSNTAEFTYIVYDVSKGSKKDDVYAFFSEKNYSVTFWDGYTDNRTTKNYTIESTQLMLPIPEHRNNYRFDGWKVTSIDDSEVGQWILNTLYTDNSITLNQHYGNIEMTAQWFETTPGYLSISANGPSDNSQSLLCSIIRVSDGQKVNDVVIRNNTVKLKLDPGEYKVIPNLSWRLNHSFNNVEYDVTVPAGGNAPVVNIQMTDKPQRTRFTESYHRF